MSLWLLRRAFCWLVVCGLGGLCRHVAALAWFDALGV